MYVRLLKCIAELQGIYRDKNHLMIVYVAVV